MKRREVITLLGGAAAAGKRYSSDIFMSEAG
jgi:hypothetical protein